MAAAATIDLSGALVVTALQNVANINASGGATGIVDLQPYVGTPMVILNNGVGATNTAIQVKLITTSDSNASNYNNYTTSANFLTATNIGTAAGVQVLNVDLRNIANASNRYLTVGYVVSGTGANAALDIMLVGQKKYST